MKIWLKKCSSKLILVTGEAAFSFFYFPKRKTPAKMAGAFFFRNLYLITQMDYFTFTFLTFDHWLNTFFPSSEVLLNAWRPA